MAWLLQALLVLLPFLGYWLWRRANPGRQVGPLLPALLLIAAVVALASGLWYGLSRSLQGGSVYVPPHLEDGRVVPGGEAPRR